MSRGAQIGWQVAGGAVLLLAYANHFGNGFHFDDFHTVQDNPAIRSLADWPRFFRDPSTFSVLPDHQSYRPLVTLSLAVDYAIGGGLTPWAFHVSTFLVFVLQTWLLAAVFRRVAEATGLATDGRIFGGVTALLLALHPANAETINYIIARSDVLSTAGVVASLWIWQAYPRWRRFQVHLIPFLLGAFAKSPAVMYGPLLFLWVLLIERAVPLTDLLRRWRDVLAAFWSALPAMVAGGAVFAFTESHHGPAMDWGGASRLEYLRTQCWVLLEYLGTFFLPLGLSADHDTPLLGAGDWRPWGGLAGLVLCLLFIIAASSRPRLRGAAFGLAWFFVALLPTSSVVPLAEVRNDHRTFFPYLGLALAVATVARVAWLQLAGPRLFRWAAVIIVMVALAAGFGTWQRNSVWHDDESLWSDVIEKSPGNGRGLMNWGLAQLTAGRPAQALDAFERARVLLPNYSLLETNLAITLAALGRGSEAEPHFRRAFVLVPPSPQLDFFYARWLMGEGRLTEARLRLEHALAQSPTYADAARFLASIRRDALPAQSPDDPAVVAAEAQVLRAPTLAGFIELGLRYFRLRRFVDCEQCHRDALRLDPRSAIAWNNLGSCFGEMGRFAEEIDACQRALSLDPRHPTAANNIAWARQQLAQRESRPAGGRR